MLTEFSLRQNRHKFSLCRLLCVLCILNQDVTDVELKIKSSRSCIPRCRCRIPASCFKFVCLTNLLPSVGVTGNGSSRCCIRAPINASGHRSQPWRAETARICQRCNIISADHAAGRLHASVYTCTCA